MPLHASKLMVFLMASAGRFDGRYHHGAAGGCHQSRRDSRGKAYKLSDRDGLYLLVTPSGGRYWRMNYRHYGKQKTLAFGVWPDTGLAEARAECDAARKVLAARRSR